MLENPLKIPRLLLYLIILLIFISLILFFLPSQDGPWDYFPQDQMVKTFRNQLNNEEFTHIIDKIKDNKIQIKQVDGQANVVMVYDLSDHMIRLVYTSEEKEFKDDYISNFKANRNDIIIKSPLELGTYWTDNIGGVYEIIGTNSMVKTPAGEFETLLVEYENDGFRVREYYAKDIGLVKIVINNYLVSELVHIERDN